MSLRYRCTVCGYVHEGGSPPESCPVCGVGAEMFEEDLPAPSPAGPHFADGSSVPEPTEQPSGPPSVGPPARHGLRLVVLGGGIAGLAAAEAARAANPDASIIMVMREPLLPYERMGLTRYLAGEMTRESLLLHPRSWFSDHRIQVMHAEARTVDRPRGVVQLQDGSLVDYDRLVLATGAHAFVPPLPGMRRDGVHVLRSMADADALLTHSRRHARVVCLGGGLLGLESSGALARRGLHVTVLDESPWLLHRQLGQRASERLTEHLARLGIHCRAGVKASQINGDDSVHSVTLADGTVLQADLVVVAAGVRPNVELARAAGLTVNRGVVVDEQLTTSDERIMAAGDCAEHNGVVNGLWSLALAQGKVAGQVLGGQTTRYEAKPPATQLKVLDVPVHSVGRFEAQQPGDQLLQSTTPNRLLTVVVNQGRVMGGNLVGDASLAGVLNRAVREGARMEDVKDLASVLGA